MKLKESVTTLTMSTALIDMCKDVYGTSNASEAIRNALADFLLLPYDEQKVDSFAIHQLLPDIDDRQKSSKVTFRLDDGLRGVLTELSRGQDSLSKTAEQMICRTLYAEQQGRSTASNTDLLYIIGNKRNAKMRKAIRQIRDTAQGVDWKISVETCAEVLGIYAKHKFADTEILNDNDWDKINLYKAIQENPRRLIVQARALKVDSATFDAQKSLLEEMKKTERSVKVNFEAAAAYLYVNQNSYRHGGEVLNYKVTQSSYCKRLAAIKPLHQRMSQTTSSIQATEFQNKDLLKLIGKYRRQKNVLFIVDPPYLDTDYYNNKAKSGDAKSDDSIPGTTKSDTTKSDTAESDTAKFGEAEHAKLARLLRLVKQNNRNDFIYFCRITAAKGDQKKPNGEEWDRHMKGRIDDLYHGHGFFFVDVDLDDVTTERIITSFPFDGATLYGKEVR